MELTFTDSGNGYFSATATVEADFNLHLEFGQPSTVQVYKSSVSGKQKSLWYESTESVFDEDFEGIIYPKYIEVRTGFEPFDGELTEVDEDVVAEADTDTSSDAEETEGE